MNSANLENVVLTRDIPERGLRAGDIGTVVQVCCGDVVEVEFVRASGETQALLTLSFGDIRKVDSGDMITTRRLAEVKLSQINVVGVAPTCRAQTHPTPFRPPPIWDFP